MSAASWIAGNKSLEAAHEKYGDDFVVAHARFRNFHDISYDDLAERAALWSDAENKGENVMAWYRARQC